MQNCAKLCKIVQNSNEQNCAKLCKAQTSNKFFHQNLYLKTRRRKNWMKSKSDLRLPLKVSRFQRKTEQVRERWGARLPRQKPNSSSNVRTWDNFCPKNPQMWELETIFVQKSPKQQKPCWLVSSLNKQLIHPPDTRGMFPTCFKWVDLCLFLEKTNKGLLPWGTKTKTAQWRRMLWLFGEALLYVKCSTADIYSNKRR